MNASALAQIQQLFAQAQYDTARQNLQQILQKFPNDVDALQWIGILEQQTQYLGLACDYLSRAAQLAPQRADILTNLGNTLRAMNRMDEARNVLEQAVALAAASSPTERAMIHINLGLVYQDLGDVALAESAFSTAILIAPTLAIAHQNLGHLLLQSDFKRARTCLIQALRLKPDLYVAFKDLCGVLLRLDELIPALRLCEQRLDQAPFDQDILAMKALALRALGRDAEADQLTDVGVFLKTYSPLPPTGIESIECWNKALEEHVLQHPKLTPVLFGHATKNGKRVNDLLVIPSEIMQIFEAWAMDRARAYFQALPYLPWHFFSSSKMPKAWKMRSWAVLMERHGYETPHIHPDGILSGVYYVKLPQIIDAKENEDQEGWIEFGEPDPVCAIKNVVPRHAVKPVAGQMLLFPSYFWHRTIPFDSDQHRLSIAFDFVAA